MMRLVSYLTQVDVTADAVFQCLLLAPFHFYLDKHKTYASDLPIGLHNRAASRSALPSRQIRSYQRGKGICHCAVSDGRFAGPTVTSRLTPTQLGKPKDVYLPAWSLLGGKREFL